MLMAANFLSIQPLLELCACTVAVEYIKGKKTPQEIAATLGIPGEYNLTKDQEKQIRSKLFEQVTAL